MFRPRPAIEKPVPVPARIERKPASVTVMTATGAETKTVRQWAADPRCSVSRQTICNRLDAGEDAESAVFSPAQRGGERAHARIRAPLASTGAEKIAVYCGARSVNVAEFAAALGLTYSTVLAMMKGEHVSYGTVFKAAMLMGEDPKALAADFGLLTSFSLKNTKNP